MITLTDVRKVYPGPHGDVVALDGINLTIPRGQIHGIVGPSGAGKSTLIRCLTALEDPTSGTVAVDGVTLTGLDQSALREARRRIGMVFQHVELFEQRTTAANVAYPLRIGKVPAPVRATRVSELLDLVGLGDKAQAYPSQLSGGQRQRVGIARALAADPAVLLCDEPSSALDPHTTRQFLELLARIRDALGLTVVIITHEMAVVRQVCDAVSLLHAGRITQSGLLGAVATQFDKELAPELIPLVEPPVGQERSLVEISYSSRRVPTKQVLALISQLGDVTVASGTVETLDGQRVGRFRLDVPAGERARVISQVKQAGLYVGVDQ